MAERELEIDDVMCELTKAWRMNPDRPFMEFLMDVIQESDSSGNVLYLEDVELLKQLKKYREKARLKQFLTGMRI